MGATLVFFGLRMGQLFGLDFWPRKKAKAKGAKSDVPVLGV